MTLRLSDQVRIDIPDELDPDFCYHGEHGIIIDITQAMCECGYGEVYRVVLEDRDLVIDLHPWDVRPPLLDSGHEKKGSHVSERT